METMIEIRKGRVSLIAELESNHPQDDTRTKLQAIDSAQKQNARRVIIMSNNHNRHVGILFQETLNLSLNFQSHAWQQ